MFIIQKNIKYIQNKHSHLKPTSQKLIIVYLNPVYCRLEGFYRKTPKAHTSAKYQLFCQYELQIDQTLQFQIQIRINRNIINIINSQNMTTRSNKQFAIIKFEQSNIQLLHKPTKKVYQYFQTPTDTQLQPHIIHKSLLRPIVYNNGLLYPLGLSNLQNEIQNRKRAHKAVQYEQQELINTFIPVLECLHYLHSQEIIHGGVYPSSIIITEDQQIQIKDWLIEPKDNIYYFNKNRKTITKDDDIIALGQIVVQAALLKKGLKLVPEKQLFPVLENLIDKYSKGFIFAVSVFLKKNKERFQFLPQYLKNDEKMLGDIELNSLYDFIKKQKEEKKKIHKVTNQNLIPNANSLKPSVLSLQQSPVKKSTPTSSLGNTIKKIKEEGENNKRVQNQETKKKQQNQKINKIIEKSNQFVNQLMNRKRNEQILKKIAPKPNIAVNISSYQTQKKIQKEAINYSSPIKKIRTISRKK